MATIATETEAGLGRSSFQTVASNASARAKRLADIYVRTHTDATGKVSDPKVYQSAIDQYLAPFGDDLTVQLKIAAFQNDANALEAKQGEIGNTVAALRLKEYNSWYVAEDGQSAGFRNPAYVAQVTSESLDMLIAETVATISAQQEVGKDTSDVENYLTDLVKRADRMRRFSDGLNDGSTTSLDGYGYFVDADPNTGRVRGASLMPTDINFKGIADGAVRTDSMVKVGNKSVPIYLPHVTDDMGTFKANFGGVEYTGNGTLLQASDSQPLVALTDTQRYQYDGDSFQMGKAYRAYTGQTNIDGSPKQDYFYVGRDQKMYKFSEDDPNGKALLDQLGQVGGIDRNNIPRINPMNAMQYATEPLPSNDMQFSKKEVLGSQLASGSSLNIINGPEEPKTGLARLPEVAKRVNTTVDSFFGRKNRPSAPAKAPARTGADIIDAGAAFFKNGPVSREALTP